MMKIKEIAVAKIVQWSNLSEAIREETGGSSAPNGTLFWIKSPTTIDEIEAQPFWFNFCRENDFLPGERLLIEV